MTDTEIRNAFISGYSQGHNDTVESCYGDPDELADDYLQEFPADQSKLERIKALRDEAITEMRTWSKDQSNYWIHNAERATYNEILEILTDENE